MTAKVRDHCNRWRSVTVAFRMSPEENEHLNHLAQLSGMTKQDYIISRLLQKEIVVQKSEGIQGAKGQNGGSTGGTETAGTWRTSFARTTGRNRANGKHDEGDEER